MKGGSIYLLALKGSKYMWFDVSKDKSHKQYNKFLVDTVNWHPDLELGSEPDGAYPQFSYESDEIGVRVDFSWICYSNNYKYVAVKESPTNPSKWKNKRCCKMMIYAIKFDDHPSSIEGGIVKIKMFPLKKFSDRIISDAFSIEAKFYRRAYAHGFLIRIW